MRDFTQLVGGVKFDPPADPAFPPVSFAGFGGDVDSLPDRVLLRVGGKQYQADAGSCIAHGYGAVGESFAAEIGAALQLCRQDIYFGARYVEGNGAEKRDGGAFPSRARQWLRDYGTVTEARKPYKASDVTTWRPPADWAADRLLLAMTFEPIPLTAEAIMWEVGHSRGAVAICHLVYPTLFRLNVGGIEGGATGAMTGGHCRAVVGYDKTMATNGYGVGAFLVLNSWQGWGLPHPSQPGVDSLSWVPFSVMTDPKWLQNADRLALPPVIGG